MAGDDQRRRVRHLRVSYPGFLQRFAERSIGQAEVVPRGAETRSPSRLFSSGPGVGPDDYSAPGSAVRTRRNSKTASSCRGTIREDDAKFVTLAALPRG